MIALPFCSLQKRTSYDQFQFNLVLMAKVIFNKNQKIMLFASFSASSETQPRVTIFGPISTSFCSIFSIIYRIQWLLYHDGAQCRLVALKLACAICLLQKGFTLVLTKKTAICLKHTDTLALNLNLAA
jgi:hypothetical protein